MKLIATGTVAVMLALLPAPSLPPYRAFAQGSKDPLERVPKLLQVLDRDGFQVEPGSFIVLDPIANACAPKPLIPSAWYNNVQPYLAALLPRDWETQPSERVLPPAYFLRQDEAILVVGATPPPMAYFSFQTFLLARYNPKTVNYASPGNFFAPYEALFSYLGDTVNSLTIRTTGPSAFNRPMALISTGSRTTREGLRAALLAAGYEASIINTETLPSSLIRFGYGSADQFLFLMRTALAVGGNAVIDKYKNDVLTGKVMQVFRVRPKVQSAPHPLPAPVLRTRGTGHTEMDLFPVMEKLRQAILSRFSSYAAEELDTSLPVPEGYPAIQRDVPWLGPDKEGSAGYGRDANYLASSWFDLGDNDFAIVYGVDHATTGKATYSSASVYLDKTLAAGVQTVDSSTFEEFPGSADSYLAGDPAAGKFYVWKVARSCGGDPYCMEAKSPDLCASRIGPQPPVRIGFRAYAEPATRTGPSDVELIYDRVIVFRPKQ